MPKRKIDFSRIARLSHHQGQALGPENLGVEDPSEPGEEQAPTSPGFGDDPGQEITKQGPVDDPALEAADSYVSSKHSSAPPGTGITPPTDPTDEALYDGDPGGRHGKKTTDRLNQETDEYGEYDEGEMQDLEQARMDGDELDEMGEDVDQIEKDEWTEPRISTLPVQIKRPDLPSPAEYVEEEKSQFDELVKEAKKFRKLAPQLGTDVEDSMEEEAPAKFTKGQRKRVAVAKRSFRNVIYNEVTQHLSFEQVDPAGRRVHVTVGSVKPKVALLFRELNKQKLVRKAMQLLKRFANMNGGIDMRRMPNKGGRSFKISVDLEKMEEGQTVFYPADLFDNLEAWSYVEPAEAEGEARLVRQDPQDDTKWEEIVVEGDSLLPAQQALTQMTTETGSRDKGWPEYNSQQGDIEEGAEFQDAAPDSPGNAADQAGEVARQETVQGEEVAPEETGVGMEGEPPENPAIGQTPSAKPREPQARPQKQTEEIPQQQEQAPPPQEEKPEQTPPVHGQPTPNDSDPEPGPPPEQGEGEQEQEQEAYKKKKPAYDEMTKDNGPSLFGK